MVEKHWSRGGGMVFHIILSRIAIPAKSIETVRISNTLGPFYPSNIVAIILFIELDC